MDCISLLHRQRPHRGVALCAASARAMGGLDSEDQPLADAEDSWMDVIASAAAEDDVETLQDMMFRHGPGNVDARVSLIGSVSLEHGHLTASISAAIAALHALISAPTVCLDRLLLLWCLAHNPVASHLQLHNLEIPQALHVASSSGSVHACALLLDNKVDDAFLFTGILKPLVNCKPFAGPGVDGGKGNESG
jgi:hypothetical protein